MQISSNEQMLGVISGKNLIMKEQQPNQLFLFRRIKNPDPNQMDKFGLIKHFVIKGNPIFYKIAMQFYFKTLKGRDPQEIIFAKQDSIIIMNIETEEVNVIANFT